jgi:hypothetical protein
VKHWDLVAGGHHEVHCKVWIFCPSTVVSQCRVFPIILQPAMCLGENLNYVTECMWTDQLHVFMIRRTFSGDKVRYPPSNQTWQWTIPHLQMMFPARNLHLVSGFPIFCYDLPIETTMFSYFPFDIESLWINVTHDHILNRKLATICSHYQPDNDPRFSKKVKLRKVTTMLTNQPLSCC